MCHGVLQMKRLISLVTLLPVFVACARLYVIVDSCLRRLRAMDSNTVKRRLQGGSNSRPLVYKTSALATELWSHTNLFLSTKHSDAKAICCHILTLSQHLLGSLVYWSKRQLINYVDICFQWRKMSSFSCLVWPVGLGVWFSLWVREVPGSNPGRALFWVKFIMIYAKPSI